MDTYDVPIPVDQSLRRTFAEHLFKQNLYDSIEACEAAVQPLGIREIQRVLTTASRDRLRAHVTLGQLFQHDSIYYTHADDYVVLALRQTLSDHPPLPGSFADWETLNNSYKANLITHIVFGVDHALDKLVKARLDGIQFGLKPARRSLLIENLATLCTTALLTEPINPRQQAWHAHQLPIDLREEARLALVSAGQDVRILDAVLDVLCIELSVRDAKIEGISTAGVTVKAMIEELGSTTPMQITAWRQYVEEAIGNEGIALVGRFIFVY